MCDESSCAYHLKCIGKSAAWLAGLGGDDEWFCPDCKNDDDIVGGTNKMAKKKFAVGTKDGTNDRGKGFACTGSNKTCTKIDKKTSGPIPGIEMGLAWMFRIHIFRRKVSTSCPLLALLELTNLVAPHSSSLEVTRMKKIEGIGLEGTCLATREL